MPGACVLQLYRLSSRTTRRGATIDVDRALKCDYDFCDRRPDPRTIRRRITLVHSTLTELN